mgnify:CR=1 FL=1
MLYGIKNKRTGRENAQPFFFDGKAEPCKRGAQVFTGQDMIGTRSETKSLDSARGEIYNITAFRRTCNHIKFNFRET